MITTRPLAPIVLFVYNRLGETEQTIAALQKNILAPESDLIIFSDGPKNNAASQQGVAAVREYLKTVGGFKSTKIVTREKNYGLAQSIISGVSEIVNQYGRIIVLEDDMVSSPYFLQYMNDGLELYENEDKVASVHGYIYPVRKTLPETFFLRGADCWGWATWKRGWDLFESDGRKLLQELEEKKLTGEFDFSGSYPYTQMLRDQIGGKNDSWAIRWYASAFLKDRLTLYPGKSLIRNIGFGGSGTHCGEETDLTPINQVEDAKVEVKKIAPEENRAARQAIIEFFRTQTCWQARGWRKIKKTLKKLFS
ncbi:MAG: glycosyltransferase [Patescibacteria group bacterium]|nr:glycosyltransferase [Patescibacteria group bacterium]